MELGLSGVLAVDFMITLTRGQYADRYPQLKQPSWCNFRFFSKIKPKKVDRVNHVPRRGDERVSYWNVEQKFEFYSKRKLVAVVTMVGEVWDRQPEIAGYTRSERSMWGVAKVSYAQSFWRHDKPEPEDWIEVDIPTTGLIGGQV